MPSGSHLHCHLQQRHTDLLSAAANNTANPVQRLAPVNSGSKGPNVPRGRNHGPHPNANERPIPLRHTPPTTTTSRQETHDPRPWRRSTNCPRHAPSCSTNPSTFDSNCPGNSSLPATPRPISFVQEALFSLRTRLDRRSVGSLPAAHQRRAHLGVPGRTGWESASSPKTSSSPHRLLDHKCLARGSEKKDDKHRPVTPGQTLRRLTAKAVLAKATVDMTPNLHARSWSSGPPSAGEATVHSIRGCLRCRSSDEDPRLLTMDLENAFDQIDRSPRPGFRPRRLAWVSGTPVLHSPAAFLAFSKSTEPSATTSGHCAAPDLDVVAAGTRPLASIHNGAAWHPDGPVGSQKMSVQPGPGHTGRLHLARTFHRHNMCDRAF